MRKTYLNQAGQLVVIVEEAKNKVRRIECAHLIATAINEERVTTLIDLYECGIPLPPIVDNFVQSIFDQVSRERAFRISDTIDELAIRFEGREHLMSEADPEQHFRYQTLIEYVKEILGNIDTNKLKYTPMEGTLCQQQQNLGTKK